MASTQTGEPHEVYAEQYEEAHLEAMGAIIGWMGGKGERAPHLTPTLHEAYQHATAAAFNAGVKGRKGDQRCLSH